VLANKRNKRLLRGRFNPGIMYFWCAYKKFYRHQFAIPKYRLHYAFGYFSLPLFLRNGVEFLCEISPDIYFKMYWVFYEVIDRLGKFHCLKLTFCILNYEKFVSNFFNTTKLKNWVVQKTNVFLKLKVIDLKNEFYFIGL